MKSVPKLRALVGALADKHDFDLNKPGAFLCLAMPGQGQLVIENISSDRISVTRYTQDEEEHRADTKIVIYTHYLEGLVNDQRDPAWTPIEVIEHSGFFGRNPLYTEEDHRGELRFYNLIGQEILAAYCEEVVVGNLQRSGWLEYGRPSDWPPGDRGDEDSHFPGPRLGAVDTDIPF